MNRRRSLLIALLVVLLGLHVFHALFQDDGGWWQVHGGIIGAIVAFFVLSVKDPVLSAGLSDFTVVLLVVGAWMFADLPPAERRRPRTYLWLLSYLLFPGLGLILYFLWLRPDHRLVAGPPAAATDSANGVTALPDLPVTLLQRREHLDETAARLAAAGYHVVTLDAAGWYAASDMHDALGAALHFPDHYGRNLDALNDCLRDVATGAYGRPADSPGLALVLHGYDRFRRADRATAEALLDIWTAQARPAARAGNRLVCLAESAEPGLRSDEGAGPDGGGAVPADRDRDG